MTKVTHQIFFGAIIANLILLLFIDKFSLHILLSISCMVILPFGKKGGMYHRIVSTAGLLSYVIYVIHK